VPGKAGNSHNTRIKFWGAGHCTGWARSLAAPSAACRTSRMRFAGKCGSWSIRVSGFSPDYSAPSRSARRSEEHTS